MRLVSTRNGVPTADDIRNIIKRGIPGTAMIPMDELRNDELDLLVDVVVQMRRSGIRERYVAMLADDEEPIDERQVEKVVRARTTPGPVVVVPDIGSASEETLATGRELFTQQACHSCHGESGGEGNASPMFDDDGHLTMPRDLGWDSYKGGNQAAALYLRILLGMPGTAHPANSNLSDEELIALVHFCQSIGQEPKRVQTNHHAHQPQQPFSSGKWAGWLFRHEKGEAPLFCGRMGRLGALTESP